MFLDNNKIRNRFQASRETLITLFTGALSLMFTQQLVTYLNEKLKEWNIFGVDSQVFALIFTGVALVVMVWFGLVKHPHKT
jgi:hypothetical protein